MLLGNLLMTWMVLRNKDGRLFGHQDGRKPEEGATSDVSFEEHLSVVGSQPTVSRETALLPVDSKSHLLSLCPPAEHRREIPFY